MTDMKIEGATIAALTALIASLMQHGLNFHAELDDNQHTWTVKLTGGY